MSSLVSKTPAQVTLELENGTVRYFEFASKYTPVSGEATNMDAYYHAYVYDPESKEFEYSTGKSAPDGFFGLKVAYDDNKITNKGRGYSYIKEILKLASDTLHYDPLRISIKGTDSQGNRISKSVSYEELSQLIEESKLVVGAQELRNSAQQEIKKTHATDHPHPVMYVKPFRESPSR